MKRKYDAYEMNEDSSLNKVIKCGDCDFKAVKAQFLDTNSCPKCGCKADRKDRKTEKKQGRW